jgi:HD-like signal output (HDOD) protein
VTNLQIAFLLLAMVAVGFGLFRLGQRSNKPKSPGQTPSPRAGEARSTAPPVLPTAQEETLDEANARHEVMQRLHTLALTTEMPQTTSNEALHEQLASGIRWTLTRIAEQPNYAPRRPLLLPKLVGAMNDDDTSRRELAQIIAADPALTGTLLGLANSPFYRVQSDPIESLDRAIAVLGIEGMRSLVAAALLQPVFRTGGGGFPHFGEVIWQHTLSAANAAQVHASTLERADPFAAQLLTLMMGMAAIVIFRVTIDQYESRHIQPLPRMVLTLLESQTASVAQQVAKSWQLSDRMDVALADQGSPRGPNTSALGRSLQVGRFLGALDVLHEQKVLDDDAVSTALRSSGTLAAAYERIWSRMAATRARQ